MTRIFYCVPFKSEAVSSRWEKDIESLTNLIESILCQTDRSLKPIVVISGHEKPDVLSGDKYNKNTIFIENFNLPIPETIGEKNKDKQEKKKSALLEISKIAEEGDYICISDADDLMHCDLFKEIGRRFLKDITDLVFFTGYVYNKATKDLAYIDGVNSIFYKICGSCIISKVTNKDVNSEFKFFYTLSDHTKFYEKCVENGRNPHKLTFPAALYMHDSILNLSSDNAQIKQLFKECSAQEDTDYINLNKYFAFKKLSSLQNSITKKLRTVSKIIV